MTAEWMFAMLAALVAAGGLVGLALRRMGLVDQGQSLFVDTGPKTAFLFRGNRLVDATPHARSLLAGTGQGGCAAFDGRGVGLDRGDPIEVERHALITGMGHLGQKVRPMRGWGRGAGRLRGHGGRPGKCRIG